MHKQSSGLFVSPVKPSAKWTLTALCVAVIMAVVGGACLAYALGLTKGTLLVSYTDKDYGLKFKYPIYDRVVKENPNTPNSRLVVDALTSDNHTSYFDSDQSSDSKSEFYMTVYKVDYEETAADLFSYMKPRCVKGNQAIYNYDKDTSTIKVLEASYQERLINGKQAAICSTVTSNQDILGGKGLTFIDRVDQVKLYVAPNKAFDIEISLFRSSATDKEKTIIKQVIDSLEVL